MTEEEELGLKREVKRLQLEIAVVKRENETIYKLLAGAHLNLRQHLKYGFNPATATSTLVSVGQFYPKLKEMMDEQENT